jgi:hypothetical protein
MPCEKDVVVWDYGTQNYFICDNGVWKPTLYDVSGLWTSNRESYWIDKGGWFHTSTEVRPGHIETPNYPIITGLVIAEVFLIWLILKYGYALYRSYRPKQPDRTEEMKQLAYEANQIYESLNRGVDDSYRNARVQSRTRQR